MDNTDEVSYLVNAGKSPGFDILDCGDDDERLRPPVRQTSSAVLADLAQSLVEVPAQALLSLINKTIFAIATEESRYTFNGALLLLKPLSRRIQSW